jgi:hypothetical protein
MNKVLQQSSAEGFKKLKISCLKSKIFTMKGITPAGGELDQALSRHDILGNHFYSVSLVALEGKEEAESA